MINFIVLFYYYYQLSVVSATVYIVNFCPVAKGSVKPVSSKATCMVRIDQVMVRS